MILVVDSNIVFAGLLKNSVTRRILLDPPCSLYAPRQLEEEIRKYEDIICLKAGLSKTEFEKLFKGITQWILFVEKTEYERFLKKAEAISNLSHEDDLPFLALALAIGADGVWTENVRHFTNLSSIRVWKTKEILTLLNPS